MSTRTIVGILLAVATASAVGVAVADPQPAAPPSTPQPTRPTLSHRRAILGVAAIEISPELREHFGAPGDRGVLVDKVLPDSAAARAGVHVGDVILDVAGTHARSALDVREAMSDHKQGDRVALDVVRDGKRLELDATVDTTSAPISSLDPSDEMPFDIHDRDSIQQWMNHVEQEMQHMVPNSTGSGGYSI
ncbi:MAG TPA: PDZ domain-containing protein [Kofleriaceae bacterium]|jgi:serine protease Do